MDIQVIEQELNEKRNLVILCGKGSNEVAEKYKGSPYFFQYPELGLDPSEVAEIIVNIIELYKTSHKGFLIHTHSDHVISGIMIQVYLKFKELKKEKPDLNIGIYNETVSILFCKDEELIKVPLTETGRIPKPPKGFFQQFNIDMKRLLTGE